jgi:hypothetical protein
MPVVWLDNLRNLNVKLFDNKELGVRRILVIYGITRYGILRVITLSLPIVMARYGDAGPGRYLSTLAWRIDTTIHGRLDTSKVAVQLLKDKLSGVSGYKILGKFGQRAIPALDFAKPNFYRISFDSTFVSKSIVISLPNHYHMKASIT